jgi:putative holliday junction resolvase
VTRVLGIDHGSRRVGLALSDPLRIAAHPFLVIPRQGAIDRILEVIAEHEVTEIVIGLPAQLGGGEGDSARAARDFAEELEKSTSLPIHLVDERFTSKIAENVMLEAGARRRTRRENVDKVAATVILQAFLDRPDDPH